MMRSALAVVVVVLASAVQAASAGPAAVPRPTVEGPIAGLPAGAAPYDPAGAGYVEQEFFVSGIAKTYTQPAKTAPYKIRILVYRPATTKAFNGTAIVEWENVTGQVPGGHPMFAWLDSYVLHEGFVFVQVAAQATPAPAGIVGHGELAHVAFDPQRYSSLKHPGDAYSLDIYSQAMRSLSARVGADPVERLKVRRIIATGNSQSADQLHTYLEDVQREVNIADAFLLDAGGSKTFTKELAVPTIHFLSEDGFGAAAPNRTRNYRLWEVPGASHNDAEFGRNLNAVNIPGAQRRTWADQNQQFADRHYGEEGPSAHATCALGPGGNEYPRRYAVAAAVRALDVWLRAGRAAPTPPRVRYAADGQPVRDAHANITGGLRLPPLDVPVATYLGSTCGLFGQTIPFDPVSLSLLYPTHATYVAKMQAATDRAMRARTLVPRDAAELMSLARRSSIGG